MGNAAWLTLALPQWYFPAFLSPFAAGGLTIIPAVGTLALLIALGSAVIRRRREIVWFLVPVAASHVLVAVAGLMRGGLGQDTANPILLIFLAAQLILCGVLVWRLRRARFEAALLSVFAMTYAVFAAFIAAMALTDVWL
ncbi:hypothetical protein N0B44_31795 [Roseibacterium beibuensis]|uniref:hypothetical protein n=1 Tax=[Roseibacterium] beibuensis TaxID=1193142 RepID=UPI00217DE8FC|nr:hypothetical protein [Roseibacterium beibuensis]MCS6627497.1 hypothetical protein [Roseibacterium beibuensis]